MISYGSFLFLSIAVEALTNSYPLQDDFDYQLDPKQHLELTRPDVRVGPYDMIGTSMKANSPIMSVPSPPKQVATVSYFPSSHSRNATVPSTDSQFERESMPVTPEPKVGRNIMNSASSPIRSHSRHKAPMPSHHAEHMSSNSPKSTTPRVTAQQFFTLIRTHVQPVALEKLMGALANFNSGKINKHTLLDTATEVLNIPNVPLEGSDEPVDLVSTFKLLILKG